MCEMTPCQPILLTMYAGTSYPPSPKPIPHPNHPKTPISPPAPYCIPTPLSLQLPTFKLVVQVGVPHNPQVRHKAWIWLA